MDERSLEIGVEERAEIRAYYDALTPAERRSRIFLVPAYRDAYNELVQAHRSVDQPAYFWERWVPVLGPVASVLYMKLRQYCFAGDGNVCWPKQETLAREIGIRSRESLRAAIALLERHGFVEREACSRLDARSGRPVRSSDRYRVFFEIPLTSEDAAELLIRSVHQLPMELEDEKAGIPPFGSQSHLAGKPPFGKSGPHEKAGLPPFGDEKAGIPPNGAGGNTAFSGSEKAGIRAAEVNVNVQRSTLNTAGGKTAFSTTAAAQDLAHEIAEELDDHRSLKFFRLVSDKLPEGRIRIVLSETRQALLEGRLRSAPGAYFTAAIRRVAVELGVSL